MGACNALRVLDQSPEVLVRLYRWCRVRLRPLPRVQGSLREHRYFSDWANRSGGPKASGGWTSATGAPNLLSSQLQKRAHRYSNTYGCRNLGFRIENEIICFSGHDFFSMFSDCFHFSRMISRKSSKDELTACILQGLLPTILTVCYAL